MTADETIGELRDRLPEDEWVDLPEFGVRVRRWADPTETWRATFADSGRSTASLLATQKALAASQADLTAMQQRYEEASRSAGSLQAALQGANAERALLQTALAAAKADKRRLMAELGSALRALDEQRILVARQDTGHACEFCTGPIVTGQAFQLLAGTEDHYAHVACPEKEN